VTFKYWRILYVHTFDRNGVEMDDISKEIRMLKYKLDYLRRADPTRQFKDLSSMML